MSLVIRLLGPFFVEIDGRPLRPLRVRKGRWLIALLALRHGRAVERDWLCGLLWPDSPDAQAKGSLRRLLTDLRNALGSEAERLQTPASSTLSLNLQAAFCDLLEFDAGIQSENESDLRAAVALYRGAFLEGCMEDWAAPERASRESRYIRALEILAHRAEERGGLTEAIANLRRVIELEPLREDVQRVLMQTLADHGDLPAVIAVYRELRLRLHRELNAEPDPATTALFQQIRSIAGEPSRRLVPSSGPASSPETVIGRHLRRLPRPLTQLVGREAEVEMLLNLLRTERLVTLTGPGGVGKTRVALDVAAKCGDLFRDGVYFVDLSVLADPDLIPRAIADLLGAQERPGCTLSEMLVRLLQARSLLLILDNCEHLLADCGQLAGTLLGACMDLHILTTSRQALGLIGEIVRNVPPLCLPDLHAGGVDNKDDVEPWLDFDAVRLFVLRAKAMYPGFRITPGNVADVVRICRLVDGIPLAIELAAARSRSLTTAQIADRLQNRLGLLTTGNRSAPARHRTLRATLDWSYALLPEAERKLLCQSAIFTGGWTLEAAEAVCTDGVLDPLTLLVDKSLVAYEERESQGRYRLLETMREYARERLAEAEWRRLSAQHADYYQQLLTTALVDIEGWVRRPVWHYRLRAERENLRQALEWRRETDADAALELAVLLYSFGISTLQERREWIERLLVEEPRLTPLYATLYRLVGAWAHYQGNHVGSYSLVETSLKIARMCSDALNAGHALAWLASVDRDRGDTELAIARSAECIACYEEAGEKSRAERQRIRLEYWNADVRAVNPFAPFENCLAVARRQGDLQLMCDALYYLGQIALRREDFAAVRDYWEEAVRILLQASPFDTPFLLRHLAAVARQQKDYSAARRYLEESLRICRDTVNWAGEGWSLYGLAAIAALQNEYAHAEQFLRRSLQIFDANGETGSAARCLRRFARFAIAQGRLDTGICLWEQNVRLIRERRWETEAEVDAEYHEDMHKARAALPPERIAAATARARLLTIEQAIQDALAGRI